MASFPQIELPPFRAQLVVQLLVQLAGALLHLLRAELPETVGGLEAVLLGYLPERAVVVVFQVPAYLPDALFPQPFVGGLAVYLAEFLAEGRYAHAEHPRQFLHAVRAVAVAVHLQPEHGGIQGLHSRFSAYCSSASVSGVGWWLTCLRRSTKK